MGKSTSLCSALFVVRAADAVSDQRVLKNGQSLRDGGGSRDWTRYWEAVSLHQRCLSQSETPVKMNCGLFAFTEASSAASRATLPSALAATASAALRDILGLLRQ
jgi:hypothetical protein